jgi:hypothetical protein
MLGVHTQIHSCQVNRCRQGQTYNASINLRRIFNKMFSHNLKWKRLKENKEKNEDLLHEPQPFHYTVDL